MRLEAQIFNYNVRGEGKIYKNVWFSLINLIGQQAELPRNLAQAWN